MKPTIIIDAPGKMPVAEMRGLFESSIRSTARLRESTPLGTMEINGRFHHYMEPDTDTLWIGFALGIRCAERLTKAAEKIDSSEAKEHLLALFATFPWKEKGEPDHG